MATLRPLDGQVALITGASAGIGWATAKRLHREGAAVVINARNKVRLDEAAQMLRSAEGCAPVIAVPGDASEIETVMRVISAGMEVGGVHVAVANVGGGVTGRTVESLAPTQQLEATQRNLVPAALLIRHAAQPLSEAGYGRIVTVASMAGRRTSLTAGPDYAAAKSAVISLTRSAALELAATGVTVNCVAPGATRTARIEARLEEMAPQSRARVVEGIPMGRIGEPDEVAAAVAFFASPDASYITGATLDVCGGAFLG